MSEPKLSPQQRLRQTAFATSANELSQLPPSHSEIAFAGRSNAGKSSALNLITGVKNLARTSKTPGRTQLINYFSVAPELFLVDLPGYGYAKVPERIKAHWQKILQGYFEERDSLHLLVMLMDIRHPLTPLDQQMLDWCEASHLQTHILLTKADKLTRNHANQALQKVKKELSHYSMPLTIQLFSAVKPEIGLKEMQELLIDWIEYHTDPEHEAALEYGAEEE